MFNVYLFSHENKERFLYVFFVDYMTDLIKKSNIWINWAEMTEDQDTKLFIKVFEIF